MIEIIKILLPLLGGGAVGALLNEWFRRRRSKVQSIPLIERVNRRISPELRGFALARVVTDASGRSLQEVNDCREYQLTMRNNTDTHLNNAEVQFEFPADDVQAWTSRPALSKTALEKVDAVPTAPWKSAFRWVIPHFPAGDSVEFTFQAIDPESERYAAAIYKADGVILQTVEGEPSLERSSSLTWLLFKDRSFLVLLGLAVAALGMYMRYDLTKPSDKVTALRATGCEMEVVSSTTPYDENSFIAQWRHSPAGIRYRITNLGTNDCLFYSPMMLIMTPTLVRPGETQGKESHSQVEPKLQNVDVFFGPDASSLTKATAPVYVRQQ